jgi:hypothetical protein
VSETLHNVFTEASKYTNLTALEASVDRPYHANGEFIASASVEAYLRAQVDSTSRPFCSVSDDGLLIIAGSLLYPHAAMPRKFLLPERRGAALCSRKHLGKKAAPFRAACSRS